MNIYKDQMSRTFTGFGHRSLRFSSIKLFAKTARLIETKLHIEPQWGWEIKVCSWDLGNMTKVDIMHIYDKTFVILVVHE